jgi:hypothetical protein
MAGFDSTKPDGGAPIALGDNDIRDNQDAVLDALGAEHVFVDQSATDQTGKHAFQVDLATNIINSPKGGPPVLGSIAFSTDQRTGWAVLVVWDGGEWVPADVDPITAGGLRTLPRLDENHNWTKAQYAAWELEVLGAGTGPGGVDLLTMNFETSPYKKTFIVADTFIANPINLPPYPDGLVANLDIVMDDPGLHTITFGDEYRAQGGLVQISTEANTKTMLSLVLLGANPGGIEILVTSVPNYAVGSVTASGQIV